MHMLYDSDSFVVVHMHPDAPLDGQALALRHTSDSEPNTSVGAAAESIVLSANPEQPEKPRLVRQGFEIVDKRSGKEVYLDGSWAEMFQLQVLAWQRNTPTQEEVEAALDGYTGLAQNPVVVH